MLSAFALALYGFAAGILLVVAAVAVGGSRGSRAEEQREREGGWRP